MAGAVASSTFICELLPGLIVLAVGGSIAPPLLLLTSMFWGSLRPFPNATALVFAYFATCAAIPIAGLTLFGGAGDTAPIIGRLISATVGGLLLVLGFRSLLNAPDPDVPPPRWMESINSMPPLKAFGFGVVLIVGVLQWRHWPEANSVSTSSWWLR